MSPTRTSLAIVLAALGPFVAAPLSAQSIPTPEEHFGFAMGTDKELARWDGILDYFTRVADASDRIVVDTAGTTTNGEEFIRITISSPANLARIEEIRAASKEIADGRISRAEAQAIADRIPATSFINHNIHSTEVGSSQTSVQLVYELATGTDGVTQAILDNVVTELIPSANPDGQILVTDWYYENVGTEYERARMPWLYHHYAGHDNNRDFFQANLIETRYWMEAMYHETYPQLYLDQHQMGTSGPRIFVPPYPDPMNPDVHPLQWQQLQFIGGGMVADLQAAGKQGVVTGSMYRIWGQEGALTGRYHNIVALLTETASARIASPDTVALSVLERGAAPGRGLSEYGFQMAFVDPWMGGEWTLGDIVDYQMISAISFLEQSARFRDHYIMGRWQMASETIALGEAEGPGAYVIPADQIDAVTAAEMVDRLILQGVEVHQATEAFSAVPQTALWYQPEDGTMPTVNESENRAEGDDEGGTEDPTTEGSDEEQRNATPHTFPEGSWVVFGAQPGRAAVLDLLEIQNRRLQHEWPGGPFVRSYDGAAYTMPLQMGVEVFRIRAEDVGAVERASSARIVTPPIPEARSSYAIDARVTRAWQVANRMLDAGHEVSRADTNEGPIFLVPASGSARSALIETTRDLGVTVTADPPGVMNVRPQLASRVGVYQGWAASMDEGWTRLVLEEFDYQYRTLMNSDVQEAGLRDHYDVIIIPSEIPLNRLINGATGDEVPPEYRGGIGEDGVENLKAFVLAGGTLVTLDRADELVLERFDVPVRNALQGLGSDEFFLPASLLRIELDTDHPLTIGSPEEVSGKWGGGRAYEPTGFGGESGKIQAVGSWAEDPDRVLMSGMLHGAEHLAGKGAILDVEYGGGRILMYGFRVQHRGQTHGTFKLLFNALLRDDPRAATQ
ncbi:MAG: M14 family metallopeptidase [Gemmatimonadota bacterium]|nr:M14 family metallopeptidase [Gemmatimonadota bacterium]MDE3006947.1 M14 family metallopeptidase [Gemmatimonadota bacterium]